MKGYTVNKKDLAYLYSFVKDKFDGINELTEYLYFPVADEDYGEDEECLSDYFDDIPYNFDTLRSIVGASRVTHGKTKVVLFFNELDDYVIKIPLAGYALYNYDEDEEEWCYEETIPFAYADDTSEELYDRLTDNEQLVFSECINGCDYCAIEALIFNIAQKDLIDSAFAGTWYLGQIYGVPVYASEKCSNCIPSVGREKIDRIITETEDLEKKMYYHSIEIESLYWMINTLGYGLTMKFFDFIKKYDIADLHQENFGMYGNRACVLDYAGFRG